MCIYILFVALLVDIGPLALRSAVDLTNVVKCDLGFDDRTSYEAMRDSAKVVLKHGQRLSLRLGRDSALVISLDGDGNHSLPKPSPALEGRLFGNGLSFAICRKRNSPARRFRARGS